MNDGKESIEDNENIIVDKIFAAKRQQIIDFNFGKDTALIFDDMLNRSIPLYPELQRMMSEIAGEYSMPNTNVYDLGCSTGITVYNICQHVNLKSNIKAIDYSQEMLNQFQEKLINNPIKQNIELIKADLNNEIDISNASIVILNLTLQFVRPIYRDRLIKSIFNGLNNGGCLILVEKVLSNDSTINRNYIKFYYEFKKRNGYSELEISQKREALENVLVPYRIDENIELLKRNGFNYPDLFYKWYNFCGLLAIK